MAEEPKALTMPADLGRAGLAAGGRAGARGRRSAAASATTATSTAAIRSTRRRCRRSRSGRRPSRRRSPLLGTPSTTSTVGGDAWYYIGQKMHRALAFMPVQMTDQHVLAVYFDKSGKVDARRQLRHAGRQGVRLRVAHHPDRRHGARLPAQHDGRSVPVHLRTRGLWRKLEPKRRVVRDFVGQHVEGADLDAGADEHVVGESLGTRVEAGAGRGHAELGDEVRSGRPLRASSGSSCPARG